MQRRNRTAVARKMPATYLAVIAEGALCASTLLAPPTTVSSFLAGLAFGSGSIAVAVLYWRSLIEAENAADDAADAYEFEQRINVLTAQARADLAPKGATE